ncbi:MAG: SRPBCC family protein [Actinomycetota bacterium]|nr:SRPBCC family protein [Actinomycetota bacterium]
MADYLFVTTWEVLVPIERLWPEVKDPETWSTWWPGLVAVKEIEPGDDQARGAVMEFRFKSRLPYTLSFRGRITRVEPPTLIEIRTVGELEGVAVYELEDLGERTRTCLRWSVRTTKPWMNILAPLARPLFSWNHDLLMKAGARGLSRKLGAEVRYPEEGS